MYPWIFAAFMVTVCLGVGLAITNLLAKWER